MTATPSPQPWRAIRRDLLIAAFVVAATFFLRWLVPDHLSDDLAGRLIGALSGLVVVFYANAVPRALVPLGRLNCDPATEQALRRFVAWSLFLGGSGFALAWLVAPASVAKPLAAACLGTALLVAVGRLGARRLLRPRH